MTANRTVALFPGARPPHLNHYETVRRLAGRVWAIYLRDHPNTRVEVASTSRVRHALDLVDHVNACAGAAA